MIDISVKYSVEQPNVYAVVAYAPRKTSFSLYIVLIWQPWALASGITGCTSTKKIKKKR